MPHLFQFGETIAGYDTPVLNEREVRAAAGILFFCALVAFMHAWLQGNFHYTQVFVIAFLIDFSIRVFVNPRYAPSMILGRFAVRNQQPEWAGAPQKRFAWAIGFTLAVIMFYLIVLNNVIGPINLIVCGTCLILMFFESAFGICLACLIYNALPNRRAAHCPGGVCEVKQHHESLRLNRVHALIVVAFLSIIAWVEMRTLPEAAPKAATTSPDCIPPDWAVAMGHSEIWKLHNGCK
ncbi:MAG: DUF4395 domain-containing protein [Betaproteobacteria bacterium]|nr:MAG: DUF4395 domain-containing protein [Betaproteobacteria bacterium]